MHLSARPALGQGLRPPQDTLSCQLCGQLPVVGMGAQACGHPVSVGDVARGGGEMGSLDPLAEAGVGERGCWKCLQAKGAAVSMEGHGAACAVLGVRALGTSRGKAAVLAEPSGAAA